MAEPFDPEAAKEALKGLFETSKTLEQRLKDLNKPVADATTFYGLNLTERKKQAEEDKILKNNERKAQKGWQEEAKKINAEYQKGEITKTQRNAMLVQNLEAQAAQIEDPKLREAFIAQSEGISRQVKIDQAAHELLNSSIADTAKRIGNASLDLVKTYQQGGSQTGLATSFLSMAASGTASAMQSVGGAASAGGQTLSAMGGKAKIAGGALQIFGTVAGIAGKGLSEIAQKVLPVLATELNKNIASFQSISSSGAMFSNGLTGMIQTAGKAGLTLDQFGGFVKANSETLAGLGEGVSGGAKRAADALAAGGSGMRKSLLNLGFTTEEQATLVAETMRDMRQSGGKLTSSDEVVAQQTQKYAENLRTIAAITGEDAKKKMDQARAASNDLAFQQKLQGLDETQRQEVINSMANMSEVQQKAFKESVIFGQVITPELAATVSQSQALGDSIAATVAAFNSGTLTPKAVQDIGIQFNDAIKQDLLNNKELALAGAAGVGGIVGEIYKNLNKTLTEVNTATPEAIAAAQEATKKQAETNDKLTKSMTDVIDANQKAALEIQKAILDSGVMTQYATAVSTSTQAMLDLVKKFKGEQDGPGGRDEQGERTGEAIGETAGTVIGTAIGALGGPIGMAIGGTLGGFIGKWVGGKVGGMDKSEIAAQAASKEGVQVMKEFALGGIADGPASGFPVMLHGREAVIPLPDNFRPDDVKKDSLESILGNMSESDRADYLKGLAGVNETGDALATIPMMQFDPKEFSDNMQMMMKTLIDRVDDLTRATLEVADHTERTARNVA